MNPLTQGDRLPSVRTLIRAVLLVLVLGSLAGLAYGYATRGETAVDYGADDRVVPPRENATVVTTSRMGDNRIVAFASNGTVLYHDTSRDIYNDIDPVPGTDATVEYVATDHLDVATCRSTAGCERNIVERVNLTTGERELVYSRITPRRRDHWHDVDRLDRHRLLVGDIALDRVFVLNTTTGVVEWGWDAQHDYSVRGGGVYPGDWTHLNDVERLPDGRMMVSLRNQDQVVFFDPEGGLQKGWTLGEDGDHDTLYEQHNPDYVPQERGGPAVVVADSENNRILEYQREDGEWNRTWAWSDLTLQWPRDADRLPNGHTLIVDTNGGRVLEVDRSGTVVWRASVDGAYDAERLGTGDESAGGPSAASLGLAPRRAGGDRSFGPRERVAIDFKHAVPGPVLNTALYVLPEWIGFRELVALAVGGTAALAWVLAELWWSRWTLRSPVARCR